jgi:anti-sigma regulatory factor (Ser/Thr protein kinase)
LQSVHVNAVESSLAEAQRFIVRNAETAGLSPAVMTKLEIVSEEIFINQVHYAYGDRGGDVEIRCEVREGMFCAEFVDDGPAFDPLAQPPPDTSAPLIERSAGGLGIELVRKLTDRMEYRRDGEKNVFCICMRLDMPEPS